MKKLFTNPVFFLVASMIAVLGLIFFAVVSMIEELWSIETSLYRMMEAICVAVLYISYKTHSKNAMKGMMGALLATVVVNCVTYVSIIIIPEDKIIAPIALILAVILFISHFWINWTHHSHPIVVALNRIAAIVLAIAHIAWYLVWFPYETSVLSSIGDAVFSVAISCVSIVIVCVESKLDVFRQNREDSGWTEE